MTPNHLQHYLPSLSDFIAYFNEESKRHGVAPVEITNLKILHAENRGVYNVTIEVTEVRNETPRTLPTILVRREGQP